MWGGILGISRNETSSETNPNAQKGVSRDQKAGLDVHSAARSQPQCSKPKTPPKRLLHRSKSKHCFRCLPVVVHYLPLADPFSEILELNLRRLLRLLFLVRRGWVLVLDQARFLLRNSGLLARSFVVSVSRVMTTMAAATTEEDAPKRDDHGAYCHADQADADTGDNTNENGQENMRGDVLEELAPAALLVRRRRPVASSGIVGMMWVRVRMTMRSFASAVAVHASLHPVTVSKALETLDLFPCHRQPLAQQGRAFVLGVLQELTLNLLNLRHEQTVFVVLDELDLDAGDVVAKGDANLNDLELNLDELELAIRVLLARADIQAKS